MADLLPVDQAIARIIAGVTPTGSETVPLADAAGRILAEPLLARRTQPPFAASAMDGYAVRAGETGVGVRLTVVGMAAAGHRATVAVGSGQAVRIFTGAPMPAGADAVLIQEDAETLDASTIAVNAAVTAGTNVRRAGLDFNEGAKLLAAGRHLGMREVSLAGAMGHGTLPVRRRPRVAILATGDELVAAGTVPGPDQIVASTGLGLAVYVAALGAEAHDLGIVRDDRAAIADAIATANSLPADILVTLGGASVGDHDLVRDALAAKGMALDFWRIAMRPGKPLIFGRLDATRVLGLPGNPVSSLVCAILFLKPLIELMLGSAVSDPTIPAELGADLPANDLRQDYLRATLIERPGGAPVATRLPVQDSSMLSVLAIADCLIVRAPLAPPSRAGDACRIIRLP